MVIIYAIMFGGDVVYVGQTIRLVQARFAQHLRCARVGENSCPHLYNHMRKNNFEGYSYILLEQCSRAASESREKFWVTKFDTFNSGLNSHPGGNQARGNAHYRKGVKGMSPAQKSACDARVGKKLSPEHVEKIRQGNLGKRQPEAFIPVICEQNGKTYQSLRDAADDLGINRANISQMLAGKVGYVRGFTFRWADSIREADRVKFNGKRRSRYEIEEK